MAVDNTYRVYIKARWADPWILRNDITPVRASLAMEPTIGSAEFKILYGSGLYEDLTAMTDGSYMSSLNRFYIKIALSPTISSTEETLVWTGVVPAEQFRLLGQTVRGRTADQNIEAYTLDYLMDTRLEKAWVEPVGGGTVKQIDHMPVFNRRIDGQGLLGNRSDTKEDFLEISPGEDRDSYVFSADGEVWTNLDIIEYLIAHNQLPVGLSGPRFMIDAPVEIKDTLAQMNDVYNFSSMTLRQALNALIPRARGLCWYIWDDTSSFIKLKIKSLLDEELTLMDVTIPANTDVTNYDLWVDPNFVETKLTKDISQKYDKIIVRGKRIKSCCTFTYDSELEKGWTSAEETAYKDAAENITGYGSMTTDEKAKENDRYRSTDRFKKVFTNFRVPSNWNWLIGTNKVNRKWNPYTGAWHTSGNNDTYWNMDKRFLNIVPFKEGYDYSGSSPDDKNPSGVQTDYRKLFAVCKDQDNKYRYVEKMDHPGAVYPLAAEMGIEIRFRPQHMFARDNFSSAEPSLVDDILDDEGYDYEDLKVTAMLETDQYFEVFHFINTTETMRTLFITIDDAELWYVVPGTVVDIEDDGTLITFGCDTKELRNDIDVLKSILAAAAAWYGKDRYKLSVTSERLLYVGDLGVIINIDDVVQYDAAGCVVTEIIYNFQEPSVTVNAGYAELDWRALSGKRDSSGISSTPSLKVAGRKIKELDTQQQEIKKEMNKSPLRIENESAVLAVEIYKKIKLFAIQSNATGSGVYNCYEQVMDATDWDLTGAVDKINNLNTTSVEVFNIAENNISGHQLSAGDFLLAWKVRDDESNERWIGVNPFPPIGDGLEIDSGILKAAIDTNDFSFSGGDITLVEYTGGDYITISSKEIDVNTAALFDTCS